ncbi:MAG: hypothetical protein COV47_00065 [Candidatus Diapherotrites archaeon CG11_big_fil_rev_8_21_14_0_20_37_9]|nr:MAG: hypothetical protein COV47_00065 [Candidatus Diapherotrites archaeon CG11_big_fil_rev_8_21_14_0_20_37_9]
MIPIPNYIEKLDNNVMIIGINDILQKSHAKSTLKYNEAGKLIGLSESYYRAHINYKPHASIWFLKLFSKKIDPEIFNKIYQKENIEFTAKTKKIKLPKKITPELAYFLGYLYGDDCLTSCKKQIIFSDEYLTQIMTIERIAQKLFDSAGYIREMNTTISLKPHYNLEIKSSVLNSFIHKVFGINRGIKTNLKIPVLIKKNKTLIQYYISGVYDADGTLPKNPEKAVQLFIDITMKDKKFIKEIKEELLGFGIETLKIYKRIAKSPTSDFLSKTYELRIRRKSMLLKFLQEINFKHPNKAIRAEKMIKLLS